MFTGQVKSRGSSRVGSNQGDLARPVIFFKLPLSTRPDSTRPATRHGEIYEDLEEPDSRTGCPHDAYSAAADLHRTVRWRQAPSVGARRLDAA